MSTPEDKAKELTDVKNELASTEKSIEMRDSLRNMKYQQELLDSAREKEVKEQEKHSKGDQYWEIVKKKIEEFKAITGQQSFVEWQTGIIDIFGAAYNLAKALQHSPSIYQLSDDAKIKKAAKFIGTGLDNFAQWSKTGIKDFAEKAAGKVGIEYTNQSHKIAYKLNVDEQGKLQTELYLNNKLISEKELTADEIKQYKGIKTQFDAGVWLWLEKRGLNANMEQDGSLRVTKTNALGVEEPLTPAMLQEISQDADQGLGAFFSGKFNLNVEDYTPPSFAPGA